MLKQLTLNAFQSTFVMYAFSQFRVYGYPYVNIPLMLFHFSCQIENSSNGNPFNSSGLAISRVVFLPRTTPRQTEPQQNNTTEHSQDNGLYILDTSILRNSANNERE